MLEERCEKSDHEMTPSWIQVRKHIPVATRPLLSADQAQYRDGIGCWQLPWYKLIFSWTQQSRLPQWGRVYIMVCRSFITTVWILCHCYAIKSHNCQLPNSFKSGCCDCESRLCPLQTTQVITTICLFPFQNVQVISFLDRGVSWLWWLPGIGGLDYWTEILDWNTGMALNCCKSLFLDMTTFQKVVTHSVTSFMPCLGVLLQSLGNWRSRAYLISFSQRLDSDIQLVLIFVHSAKL